LLITKIVIYCGIIKTNDMKIGQKFTKTYTTPFGKKIISEITVIAIDGCNVLFDNGAWYNELQLKF